MVITSMQALLDLGLNAIRSQMMDLLSVEKNVMMEITLQMMDAQIIRSIHFISVLRVVDRVLLFA